MKNYFELLGLSPAFELDLSSLEAAYFTAQRQFHPDRFVGKPAVERAQAMQRSADINNAYETLKNPLKRAQYLLHLKGITVGTETGGVKPTQAVLMEAMELREEPKTKDVLQQMINESITRIAAHYRQSDFDAMAQETLRLGYLMKVKP